MCGFGGVINSQKLISKEKLSRIASMVAHRGPDNTQFSILNERLNPGNEGIHAFFFNRLAIIDLDNRSNQPFGDEAHLLVFNGEIYNYKEIKNKLLTCGYTFSTASDTEVLFFALKEWGKAILPQLNGMFSFVWFNKENGEILLSRDRLGIKPLYYFREGQSLIFSSELSSIIRFSSKELILSEKAVRYFLCLQYVPSPYSIIDEIQKLPPGCYLEGSIDSLNKDESLTLKPYWNCYSLIETNHLQIKENQDLESLIVNSLSLQLEADVPIGLFLSSGIDSSLLAAIVNKHFSKNKEYTFFTVSFDQKTESDESEDAIEFIKGFNNPNLRHQVLCIDSNDVFNRLESLYDYYDEPFGDPTALLNWVISEKAKKTATVVLSGDGADELFWGYPRYDIWKKKVNENYRKIPLLVQFSSIFKFLLPNSILKNKILNALESDPLMLHFDLLRHHELSFIEKISEQSDLWCMEGIEILKSKIDLPSILDMKTYLTDAMLYKVDRSSMAASLEVRVPYLDNEIVNYALQLPFKYKSTEEYKNKAPLKSLLTRLAPHYDITTPKKGFNFPLSRWVQVDWKNRIIAILTKENIESLGLESGQYLKMVKNHYSGKSDNTKGIWYLLNLVLWNKKFKTIKS